MNKLGTIIKKVFGVILCIIAFAFTVTTEQVDRNMQPLFVITAILCAVSAVFFA